MLANDFIDIITKELNRVKRANGVNIVLNVSLVNGTSRSIRLTPEGGWYKAPEIINPVTEQNPNAGANVVKLAGAENSVKTAVITSNSGYINRTSWNRSILYIDTNQVSDMNYTFDIQTDEAIQTPTEPDDNNGN